MISLYTYHTCTCTHTRTHTLAQSGGIDMDVVTEAHGLIGDLLLNEAYSDNTRDQLRRVRELLAPKVNKQIQYGPRTFIGM